MFDDSSNNEVTKPLGDSSSLCIVILHIYNISTDNFCHKNIYNTNNKYNFTLYFKIISISFKMTVLDCQLSFLRKDTFPSEIILFPFEGGGC